MLPSLQVKTKEVPKNPRLKIKRIILFSSLALLLLIVAALFILKKNSETNNVSNGVDQESEKPNDVQTINIYESLTAPEADNGSISPEKAAEIRAAEESLTPKGKKPTEVKSEKPISPENEQVIISGEMNEEEEEYVEILDSLSAE